MGKIIAQVLLAGIVIVTAAAGVIDVAEEYNMPEAVRVSDDPPAATVTIPFQSPDGSDHPLSAVSVIPTPTPEPIIIISVLPTPAPTSMPISPVATPVPEVFDFWQELLDDGWECSPIPSGLIGECIVVDIRECTRLDECCRFEFLNHNCRPCGGD